MNNLDIVYRLYVRTCVGYQVVIIDPYEQWSSQYSVYFYLILWHDASIRDLDPEFYQPSPEGTCTHPILCGDLLPCLEESRKRHLIFHHPIF